MQACRTAPLWFLVVLCVPRLTAAQCETGEFPSTYALIQRAIFENRGCTNAICHGESRAAGLDLRAAASYDALVDVDATSVPGHKRVTAAQKDQSLLWLNLAAKTYPDLYRSPLRPMPLDPLPALAENELEAVRLWIETGAPREGVIPGTDTLLDACLPPPEPLEAKPLDPPAPGTGIQVRMPRWVLPARTEHEVCFVSYYDISDQVPAEFRGPSGTTFRFKRNQVRQDPLSHHLIVSLYTGATPPSSPVWGSFTCRGGPREGEPCDPVDLEFCGPDGACATDPIVGVACINQPPEDSGFNQIGFSGTQETGYEFNYFPGVYGELPLQGMLLWNSHAFNLTDKPGKLDAWLNFDFAAPAEQETPARSIFNMDQIFKMQVPAFTSQEVCSWHVLPRNAHLYELSSHAHQRNKRFRTFNGAWRCEGGAHGGQPCSPLEADAGAPDLCAGAACVADRNVYVGDCDRSETVTVNELISAVGHALNDTLPAACDAIDLDDSGRITVDELQRAVRTALTQLPQAAPRDGAASLLYTNLLYNDPLILRFDPPMVFAASAADDRTLTYCGLYDNGYADPATVKRRATSPPAGFGIGGPCQIPTGCTAGNVGAACAGGNEAARNASCDSAAGAGDGECDACVLTGGVTTEDEMFILMGEYYVP